MSFRRLGGFRLNRRRALEVMGLVVALVAFVALVSRLLAPPDPVPLPAQVGLVGLETEAPGLPEEDLSDPDRLDLTDRSSSRNDSRRSRREPVRAGKSSRKPSTSLRGPSPIPSGWAPAASSPPPKPDRPGQFGFER
jgi:hypothetical protein